MPQLGVDRPDQPGWTDLGGPTRPDPTRPDPTRPDPTRPTWVGQASSGGDCLTTKLLKPDQLSSRAAVQLSRFSVKVAVLVEQASPENAKPT